MRALSGASPPLKHPGAHLIHEDSEIQVWDVGIDQVLKIRPRSPPSSESRVQEFLEMNTTIPMPKILQESIDEDTGMHYLYMQNVQGVPLNEAWGGMSSKTRESIADQMVAITRQLSSLRSQYLGGLGETPIWDCHLFCGPPVLQGPFYDSGDLFTALSATIDEEYAPALPLLRRLMPRAIPAAFTHCNLHMGNIMVHRGRIVAILGWETAGYFPIWWEYTKLRISSAVATEWQELLRRRGLEVYPDAKHFVDVLGVMRGGGKNAARMVDALVQGGFAARYAVLKQVQVSIG